MIGPTRNCLILQRAATDPTVTFVAGGTADDLVGYFVRPTILEVTDPEHARFSIDYIGPVLVVHLYQDDDHGAMLDQMRWVSTRTTKENFVTSASYGYPHIL
jgi:1-pyrroline-5-carboxylate dehydrogenase